MRIGIAIGLLFFVASFPAHSAEGAKPVRHSFVEPHMGTRFQLIFYAVDDAMAKKAAKEAFARVAELNAIMSDYQSTSELMRLCGKAGGPAVKVSDELFTVLARAKKVSAESDGAFDVTIGPVVRLWRVARKTKRLPDPQKLAAARALVGYQNMELDAKARTVRLGKAGMQLDLGGIAKGYAADEVLRVLARHGIKQALVAAGGDITVADAPPGKGGWTIAIDPIDAKKEGPRYLTLAHAAVSTSGDAVQHVEIDAKRYSHIVDPKTGLGLPGRMSATVVAPDGITADSLTKVVAILGPKKGFAVLERYKGVSGRFVLNLDGKFVVERSKGFPTLHGPRVPKTPPGATMDHPAWARFQSASGTVLNPPGGGRPGFRCAVEYTDRGGAVQTVRPLASSRPAPGAARAGRPDVGRHPCPRTAPPMSVCSTAPRRPTRGGTSRPCAAGPTPQPCPRPAPPGTPPLARRRAALVRAPVAPPCTR